MNRPDLHATAFVHRSATVIGNVTLQEDANIWPGAVLRGDKNRITVGARSNIQDLCLCHVDADAACTIGAEVTCGHHVTLHGCAVGNRCMIGIGATILSHAVLGDYVIVGAGSLVTEGKTLESGYVYYGSPVKRVRLITGDEKREIERSAAQYCELAQAYRKGLYQEVGSL